MIPLRPYFTKPTLEYPSWIIIHHTAELKGLEKQYRYDKPTFLSGKLERMNYQKNKTPNTGYHYIIEKIGQDFHPIVSQPILTKCEWPDLDAKYQNGIHIAFMGDYNYDIPMTRMYIVIAYRLFYPLMRAFRIKEDRIVAHRDVSNDEEVDCPGDFLDFDKIKMFARQFRRNIAVKRN